MKNTLLALLAASAATAALASPLTPQQALARLESSPSQRRLAPGAKSLRLVASMPEIYVFSSGKGYEILPADDCAQALLGYSESGEFDSSNPAFEWWLGEYGRQMEFARRNGAPLMAPRRLAGPEIQPLVKTLWDQGGPYNLLCPEYRGHRCPVGCVATAMAQVMKYYNYPPVGTGEHSYHWAKGDTTLSFDYAATRFDWAQMADVYDNRSTEAQKQAVAQLMYAVGVSVNMIYLPGESGAYSQDMGGAMTSHFGYDKSYWMPSRDYYDLDTWQQMCYDNLAAGMPILYTGVGADGGHQFICDGYSSDGYFHFNWGWGGMSDGWFLLTGLNPQAIGIGGGDGGFNYQQMASLNVRPAQEGSKPVYFLYATQGFKSPKTAWKLGEKATFAGNYKNQSLEVLPEDSWIGVSIVPQQADGAEAPDTLRLKGRAVHGIGPYSGPGNMEVELPADLPEGTYTISPSLLVEGSWRPVRTPLSANPSFLATVSGDSLFLSKPSEAILGAQDMDIVSEVVWGDLFSLKFNATNTGTREFLGNVYPQLLTPEGNDTVVANGERQPIDVPVGGPTPITYLGKWALNKAYSTEVPQPGPYRLRMMNGNTGEPFGPVMDVNLVKSTTASKITVWDLHFVEPDPSAHRTDVQFTMHVKCTEGYYPGTVGVWIFPGAGDYDVASKNTDPLFLKEGEETDPVVSMDLSVIPDGHYVAACRAQGAFKGNYLYFRLETPTGLETLREKAAEGKVFDLNGVPVTDPQRGRLYLLDGECILWR